MNPIIVVRGIAGVTLPLALGAAYVERRRASKARRRDAAPRPRRGRRARTLPEDGAGSARATVARRRDLTGFDLSHQDLTHMDLANKDLARVDLSHATLVGSNLSHAHLLGATLDFADLGRCDLRDADLTAASVLETNFWRADLRGADLRLCLNLLMANFRGARFDHHTRWPANFDPTAAGALLERPPRR